VSPRPSISTGAWHSGLLLFFIASLAVLYVRIRNPQTYSGPATVSNSPLAAASLPLGTAATVPRVHVPSSLEMRLAAAEIESDFDARSQMLEQAVQSIPNADLPAALEAASQRNGPEATEFR
jgi:hypothetical protein